MLGLIFDVATIIYRKVRPLKIEPRDIGDLTVSAICPVYNEESTLQSVVEGLMNQTITLKNIFIVDDRSTDSTCKIGKMLQNRYPGRVFYVLAKENSGKAKNVNNLLEEKYFELGDLIFINDGDCVPLPDCIESIMQKFKDRRVAAITGMPYIPDSTGWPNKIFTNAKKWQVNLYGFRKIGQCGRNAMYVLCGAITIYDKKVLKKYPLPTRTVTEDLDHTWVLLEAGYRLEFESNAFTIAPDVTNLKSQWAQSYRWNKGFWQTFYFHCMEGGLEKTFWLKFSVIYASFFDMFLLLLRYVLILTYFYTGYNTILALLFGEMLLYVIPGAVLYGVKGVLHIPYNYIFQMMVLLTYILSGIEVTWQYLKGRFDTWGNRWNRNYGDRSMIIENVI